MQATETLDMPLPWYRQMWPWFIISIPLATVIAGIATIIIAVNSPDSLVVDDYYKEGLAINLEKERLVTAQEMRLEGLLRSKATVLTLQLDSKQPVAADQLELKIVHVTRAELDQTITMQRTDGNIYTADFSGLQAGNWYLHLKPENNSWLIRGRINVNGDFQAYLTTMKL